MKIVYLNPSAQLGGAEAALYTLLSTIREDYPDWDVELIVSENGPLLSRMEDIGVVVRIVPLPGVVSDVGDSGAGGPAGARVSLGSVIGRLVLAGPALALYVSRLRRQLRTARPDVVQSNGFKMHLLAVLACPARVPLIWHIHDYVSPRPLMSRLLRMAARFCTVAVTNSRSVAYDLTKVCGHGLEVVPVHNAVDVRLFHPEGAAVDLDALSGMPQLTEDIVRIGLVGTMARWKGHETFLRALAALRSDLPFRGYVIGGEVYQTRGSQVSIATLRQSAHDLGLDGRAGFTGFIEDAAGAMRALDVVVHASTLPEPFGLVIVEAMASCRPVVVSAAGGAKEIVDVCGLLLHYPPGDHLALAAILTRLIEDASLREKAGREGRRCVESHFTTARLGRQFADLYMRITGFEITDGTRNAG